MSSVFERDAITNALWEVGNDIAIADPLLMGNPTPRDVIKRNVYAGRTVVLSRAIFESALRIIKADRHLPWHPQTPFGQAVKQVVEMPNVNMHPMDSVIGTFYCPAAEPNLIKSLDRHDLPERVNPKMRPAIVYLDADGEPFGYNKTAGVKSTYSWRTANIETSEGTRTIPADSFSIIDLMPEYTPAYGSFDGNVMTMQLTPEKVQDVKVGRLSHFTLPANLRWAMPYAAAETMPNIRGYEARGATFKPEQIAERAIGLLEKIPA